jgi:hypothetical protein
MAEALGVKRHQVEYILAKRGIKPQGIAGHCFYYTADALETVRHILGAMKRDGVRPEAPYADYWGGFGPNDPRGGSHGQ